MKIQKKKKMELPKKKPNHEYYVGASCMKGIKGKKKRKKKDNDILFV